VDNADLWLWAATSNTACWIIPRNDMVFISVNRIIIFEQHFIRGSAVFSECRGQRVYPEFVGRVYLGGRERENETTESAIT
jgi:hypothetical protein